MARTLVRVPLFLSNRLCCKALRRGFHTSPIKLRSLNLSKTINLPQTRFTVHLNAAVTEPKLRPICCDGLYEWQRSRERMDVQERRGRSARSGSVREEFVLHDGPPYANGQLHIGHFLNKVLKDIINRFVKISFLLCCDRVLHVCVCVCVCVCECV